MANNIPTRAYYSLLINHEVSGWGVEFGDYDRETVEQEIESLVDDGTIPAYSSEFVRIVRTADNQSAIDTAVRIENLATLENALEWHRVQEKFTYCIDALEISAHNSNADQLVDQLEKRFNQLLGVDVL